MNGAVYLSDTSSRKVFKVKSLNVVKDAAKNLELVAGTGDQCLPYDDARCGDGGKATEAILTNPRGTRRFQSKSAKTVGINKGRRRRAMLIDTVGLKSPRDDGLAVEHQLEGVKKNLIIDIEIDPVSRISVCCHPFSLPPLLNEFLIKSVSKMVSL